MEYRELLKNPKPYIKAHPNPNNILEWHYCLEGPPDSPYEGGFYHGKLKFPKEYPNKPPSILMLTPNGRFETGKRLCFSMSDFHPKEWSPLWSVGTILNGVLSFMLEEERTLGSVETPLETKRLLAQNSLSFNQKNQLFTTMFPEYANQVAPSPLQIEASKEVESSPPIPNESPCPQYAEIFLSVLILLFAMVILFISLMM